MMSYLLVPAVLEERELLVVEEGGWEGQCVRCVLRGGPCILTVYNIDILFYRAASRCDFE